MSRPKPEVLVEKIDKNTYKAEQVLASHGIWSVYYQGRPINLKTHNMLISYPGPKYKKVSVTLAMLLTWQGNLTRNLTVKISQLSCLRRVT